MKESRTGIIIIFILMLAATNSNTLLAQDTAPQNIRELVDSFVKMLSSDEPNSVEVFIQNYMSHDSGSDTDSSKTVLKSIKTDLSGEIDDLSVEPDPDGLILRISGNEKDKVIKFVMSPEGLTKVVIMKSPERLKITKDNINDVFDDLESKGLAGVVYVKLSDGFEFRKGFGEANRETGRKNDLNTIFAIGSRPIDFTVASIYLLEQRGLIMQDDPISKYFENVPEDKSEMTIRHLMTGRSGLPDFFHTDDDWDPDLAWIDRRTAEKRLLSEELIFSPGEDRRHSHAAFVLLSALIERVSGMEYYSFIRTSFLDPAGMEHTGEYGESSDHQADDFAEGYGIQKIGLPNIPPNWGPTSWLIKGSGGMYSTLEDLQKFYSYIRSGRVLKPDFKKHFEQETANLDGSVRGFELFSAYHPKGNEVYLFLNSIGDQSLMRSTIRALENMVMRN